MDEVLSFKQMVVWDKGKMGMGWHYRRSYETILVAQNGNGKTNWYDDSHTIENVIRPGDYGIQKIIPGADDHPTPKPVALAEHFLRLYTKPGDTVLDPFMGHGWVGIAALNLGRNFIGIEVDPEHFGQAERRIGARKELQRLSLFPDGFAAEVATRKGFQTNSLFPDEALAFADSEINPRDDHDH